MKTFNLRIFTLFVFIIISWGLAWPVNKIGLVFMTPLWYTAIRLSIATIAMFGIVVLIKKFTLPKRTDIPLILIVGFLQIAFYILLANVGLAYLPAGRSSLLAYTTPLWLMPIATIFFKERHSLYKWAGFLLGTLGLILLINPLSLDWKDINTLIGTGALLLASFCWAISMLGIRYLKWTKTPLELIPWQLLVGTLPILLFAFVKEPFAVTHWNYQLILSLIYTGILVTGLSYWCGVIINKELPSIIVSIGFLAVPVFSFIISAHYLNETISKLTLIAISLIILGLVFIVFEKKEKMVKT